MIHLPTCNYFEPIYEDDQYALRYAQECYCYKHCQLLNIINCFDCEYARKDDDPSIIFIKEKIT